MRVLYILNELRFSGLEMMLLNSSSEWGKYDIAIDILATGDNLGEAADLFMKNGYRVIHIPFRINKIDAFLKLRSHLGLNKYDIIHNHTEANFMLHCINTYFTGHCKMVHTFHSNFRWTYLGLIKRNLNRFIAKLLGVKFVAVSKSVAVNEAKILGTKSSVIYNWYDDKKYSLSNYKDKVKLRADLGIPENSFVITTTGNCSPIKRHELILEALATLPQPINWLFIHIGCETSDKNERNIAKDLKIYEKCLFIGASNDVRDLLTISDVFVMSSRVEGFSIAALEAIGSGIPTILTDVPGLSDVLENISGTISANADGSNLGLKIEEFYYLPSIGKKKIAEMTSEKCRDFFSMERGVNEYFKFYYSLL